MKLILFQLSLLLIPVLSGWGQGSLTYQTTLGVGKEKYVFGVDPTQRFIPKYGGTLDDYASFSRIEGDGFYAELWWRLADSPFGLLPVPGSLVTFQTGSNAGLINGKDRLDIPGTYGGDKVVLELRVWDNFNQTVETWAEAIDGWGQHGVSAMWTHELSGIDRQGASHLGSGSIAFGLNYFSVVLPEPSSIALALLGLGGLAVSRTRRS